jgi:hypothetical protein
MDRMNNAGITFGYFEFTDNAENPTIEGFLQEVSYSYGYRYL